MCSMGYNDGLFGVQIIFSALPPASMLRTSIAEQTTPSWILISNYTLIGVLDHDFQKIHNLTEI